MKLILIGYMASGKSLIGSLLAQELNLSFIDLDQEIAKQENKSISDIFSEKGEIYFRKRENQILKDVLSRPGDLVLATGGGTPCYADSLEFMLSQKDTKIIYLRVSLPSLTARLFADKDNRPLLAHLQEEEEVADFIRKHLFERAYYYNQAQVIVTNEKIAPKKLVSQLIKDLF